GARRSSACSPWSWPFLWVLLPEPHAVAVAVGAGALVGVAAGVGVDQLAQDDHARRAAVDAEGAPGADVVVDDEDGVVSGVEPGPLGADGLVDRVGGHEVDALPGADVDAALAGDALGLV